MKFALPITTLVASVLLATNVKAWKPSPGLTWDYLLGAERNVILASKANVVTIDLEKAKDLVPTLHGKSQRVICYFSGGTMQESRRSDYNDYLKANIALPEKSSWGNHYIDIRNKAKLQPLIRNRMVRARDAGCDAVEVDSLGLYIHHIRDYTKEDTIVFGKWLAETAHSVGISIGLKNVAGCSEALEPYFDFAVVESCADSPNVCNYYTKFSNHGKAVFIVHYGDLGYKLSGSSLQRLIKETGNRNFICVLSDSQKLHHNSVNFNCNNGSVIGSSGSVPQITTQKKTTTTVKKTTTAKAVPTSKPVIPNIPKSVATTKQIPTTKTIPTNGAAQATPARPVIPGVPGVPGLQGTPAKSLIPGAQTTPAKSLIPGLQGNQTLPGIPGVQGNQTLPGAPGNATQPGLSNLVPSSGTKEVAKGVNNENKTKTEEDGGNGLGTAVAVVAASGGIAAAVAGFVFLKKHKKFSKDEYTLAY